MIAQKKINYQKQRFHIREASIKNHLLYLSVSVLFIILQNKSSYGAAQTKETEKKLQLSENFLSGYLPKTHLCRQRQLDTDEKQISRISARRSHRLCLSLFRY